jgi:hypothetical protein
MATAQQDTMLPTMTAAALLALAQEARQTRQAQQEAELAKQKDERAKRDATCIKARQDEAARIIAKFQQAMESGTIAKAAQQGRTSQAIDHFYPPNSTLPDGTMAPWDLTHTAPKEGCPRILVVLGPRPTDQTGKPSGKPDPSLLPGGKTALDIAKESLPAGFYLFTEFSPKTRPDGSPNPYFKRNTIYITWEQPDTRPKTKHQQRRPPPAPTTKQDTTTTTTEEKDPLQQLANMCKA